MLELTNIFNKANPTITVEHNNNKIEFVIGTIISKRNKEDLDPDNQFTLFNKYLDYKGKSFKDELFNRYVNAEEQIMYTITKKEIHPLPYNIIHPILDMFDLQDVLHYVKDIYQLKAPSNLAVEFDYMYEQDMRGSRVQTYLVQDYLELAAVTIILKSVLGPLSHFAYIKQKDINNHHKEYILFYFILMHKIYNVPPMQKLLGLVEKLVQVPTNDAEADAVRIIEKNISKEDMALYILAIVVLQRITTATLIHDDAERNVITRVYNYINNKLKNNGDVSKSIRNKTALTDVEAGDGEKESIVESFRIITDLTVGNIVELNWSISDINMILAQTQIDIDFSTGKHILIQKELLIDAISASKHFLHGGISQLQVTILGYIFKDIVDPRGLDHTKIDGIVNLVAIGFCYLWGLGYKNLALLLMSYIDTHSQDTLSINITVNRSRITKELKEELNNHFPYQRVVNETTSVNVVEEAINELSNELFKHRWIPINGMSKYVEEVLGNDKNYNKLLPAELKLILADFIITNERIKNVSTTIK